MAFTMTVAELIDADTSGMLGKHATWERVPLAEVATILNGAPFDSALFSTTEGIPLIRIRDVTTGQTNTYYTGTYEDAYLVQQGDLLVGMDGDFNSGFWGPKTALLNQRVCKISPAESFYDRRLLALTLPGYLAAINANTPSVTVKHLSSKTIGEIGLPLPPRAEQARIVAKLEELLSDLDAGVTELKAAQKKLAQYRQSLLKAAVEGALTAGWRAARAPLPPGGGGAGGEGANPLTQSGRDDQTPPLPNPSPARGEGLNTDDQIWLADRARDLRRDQTPDEQALWYQLRGKRFAGYKFRRQQVLGRFIVDFVCLAKRVIVELDGGQHATAVGPDRARDEWLGQQGFRVLRFWNNEWSSQPEGVLEAIWLALQHEPPLPNPSPARGEGLHTAAAERSPSVGLNAPLPLDGGGAGGEGATGAQLLERILTERRSRWEAKQLAKFAEQCKSPPKDWQKKYPEPVQPDTTGLPGLPEGWVWSSLGECFHVAVGATPSRKEPSYWGGSIPWVSSGEVRFSRITATREMITQDGLNNSSTQINPVGSVLLGMIGEGKTRGQVAILDVEAANNQNCAAIWASEAGMPSEYVYFWLWSQYEQTRRGSSGNNQPALNKSIVERIFFPLAPLGEMNEIVRLVSQLLDAISEQELAIEISLKQSTTQRQNILRAAFSGQLVPQDPADEPASVLLERIRAERAAQATLKKPRARKTKEAA